MKVCCDPVDALGSRGMKVALCCPPSCDVGDARAAEEKGSFIVRAVLACVSEGLFKFSQ